MRHIFAMLLLASCSAGAGYSESAVSIGQVRVCFRSELPGERETFLDAVAAWDAVSECVRVLPCDEGLPVLEWDAPGRALGRGDYLERVLVDREKIRANLHLGVSERVVIGHEIGHVLGVWHAEGECLMHPESTWETICQPSIDELNARWCEVMR